MSEETESKAEPRTVRLKREAASLGKLVAVVLLFRAFVAQAYYIPSESMRPTLEIGDDVFVNRLAYVAKSPARGDIVVFDHPHEHGKDLIKRVVAIGGDTVVGHDGQVWVNGNASGPSYDFAEIQIPRDNLFVMGDNRGNSSDSRVWGTVPVGLVAGRAFVILWSTASMKRALHVL